jgi:hypothetical protein
MRACCGLLLLCILASAVPAEAKGAPAPADQILTSGPYTIRIRESVMGDGGGMVRISRRGRVLLTLRGYMIERAEFRSLLDPRSDDLIVETFSGGAHCCYVYYIMHLGPRLHPLLVFNARDYDRIDFRDLDHDGRQEIIAQDDTFAFYDYSFAASPELPFVFRYERGRYRDATASFRWLVKADQEKAERQLLKAVHDYGAAARRPLGKQTTDDRQFELQWRDEDIYSAIVSVYSDALLLNRGRQTERWLRAHLPRQDRSSLRSHRGEIRRMLRTRDSKLTYRFSKPPNDRPYWYIE